MLLESPAGKQAVFVKDNNSYELTAGHLAESFVPKSRSNLKQRSNQSKSESVFS